MSTARISLMLFSNSSTRAGVEEHILQLLHGLDRSQFEVHLACPPELVQLFGKDIPEDITVSPVTLDSPKDLAGMMALVLALRKHRVQILHSHLFRASLFASPLAHLAGIPVVMDTAHVREVWRRGWRSSFLIDRAAARFVDHTIAVSNAIARYLVEEKGIPPAKVSVIRTAPALTNTVQDDDSRETRKKKLGFAENDLLLILAGRLEPQKGHQVLIAAMPSVLEQFPNVRLVFLGEGSLAEELKSIVAANQLENSIRFAGYRRDLPSWFAAADLSILPSFYEGLPMVALESLLAECPIVATAVDGTPEIVINRKTGLLVPPGDSSALSGAICSMLRDTGFARQTALAGAKYVRENFSVQKLIACTQEQYLAQWEQHLRASGKQKHATVAQHSVPLKKTTMTAIPRD